MKSLLVALACAACAALCAPPAHAQPPTMDELWPGDDGHSWTYDLHYESYGADAEVVDRQVRLFLDGTTVAAGGIAAQYLRQESVGGTQPAGRLASQVSDPFLRAVWVARPDLRAGILRAEAESDCPQFAPASPHAILLNGEFAWLKSSEEIAAWRCNLASTRSWVWLVSDLGVGNTFTLQLVPDLADDVYLHGTIAPTETANVPAGTFEGCVRVDYVVDYGTGVCTDESGNPVGTSEYETRGFVLYAPRVGPVQCDEALVAVEATGDCGSVGTLSQLTMRLGSTAVPARPGTWGRLKVAYR